MLTFPTLVHHQIAYVTNDMDAALARFADEFGILRVHRMDTTAQGAGPRQPRLLLALGRTANVEFEMIQPLEHDPVYAAALPPGPELAIRFHHIAFTITGSAQDYEDFRAGIDEARHPVVIEGAVGDDARWFYTDERRVFGHYIEYCWFSPAIAQVMKDLTPVQEPVRTRV